MGRKVFISILGYSNYGACYYIQHSKKFKSKKVRYIQEATLDYLTQIEKWEKTDVAYVLLTNGAEEKNWQDNGHVNRLGEIIEQTGLETQLKEMKLLFPVFPIKGLPNGNNEKEIWQIFERVFELIKDGDELYFDLTHGFRYLPMLILVLGNYAKFLKGVKVKSITYGNYEARNRETEEADMIDLYPLSDLQDWTFAAASFLKNGNVSQLKSLCDSDLKPILKEAKGRNINAVTLKKYMTALENIINDMNTCRGIAILQGENMKELWNCSSQLTDVIIEPLKPVIEKIKTSFAEFVPSLNIKNGYIAAKWCLDHQLYQQALTILHENIISHVCESEGWNIQDFKYRSAVSESFNIYNNKIKREDWNVKDVQLSLIEKALSNLLLQNLASSFVVTTNLRNDYNHSGMRTNPASKQRIIFRLEERMGIVYSMLDKLCL